MTEMLTVVLDDHDFHCMFCGTKTIEMPKDEDANQAPVTNPCEHLRFIAVEGGFEFLDPQAAPWVKIYEETGDPVDLEKAAPSCYYMFELASPPPAGLSVYVGYRHSPYLLD